MMDVWKKSILALVAMISLLVLFLPDIQAGGTDRALIAIDNWQQRWEERLQGDESSPLKKWTEVRHAEAEAPVKPAGVKAVWIRFSLPETSGTDSLYIPKLYAQNVDITFNGTPIYHAERTFTYDVYRIVAALPENASGGQVTIRAESGTERIGLAASVMAGQHNTIERLNARANIKEIALGGSFIFVALVMYACVWFLKRSQWGPWLSLGTMILSIGIMMVTYAPFLYMVFGRFGSLYYQLFDISLAFFLPALTYFFEQIFGPGKFRFFTRFRKFQVGYSLFLTVALICNLMTAGQYFSVYFFFSVTLLGLIMLIQFPLIVGATVVYTKRGDKDAGILAIGIGAFALIGTGELIWFYLHKQTYDLYYWKLGVVFFIGSLLVLLGRRMAANHNKVVQYTRELQDYIGKMQRSEKVGAIHELAPSIAQEVSEPLEKTKELLQQMAIRADQPKERGHLNLAIEELDRAASILTDYFTLTDAKAVENELLHIQEELTQVAEIVQPFAELHGGIVTLDTVEGLYIYGSSEQLRQSLLNLIKNALEALGGEGQVQLRAYREESTIVILVQDNGKGMDDETLKRLGDPYFTTGKVNGTGLGLMATFQLIERMKGTLTFSSRSGEGTEACIRLPAA